MKFDIAGVEPGKELEQFQTDWVGLTIEENSMILGVGQISRAQLLVINLYCGNDKAYRDPDNCVITTIGPAQSELEALFRARGRALAMFFQERIKKAE
jgi:hypothetical protein